MLWHLQIDPAPGRIDLAGRRVAADAAELGLPGPWRSRPAAGSWSRVPLDRDDLDRAAEAVLVDPVVETFAIRPASRGPVDGPGTVVHVLPKPGVTDPEAESALALLRDLGFAAENVRTIRTYRVEGPADALPRLIQRVLANDAVEQAVVGALAVRPARPGAALSLPPRRGADPRHGRRRADGPEQVGAALPEPRRDAGRSRPTSPSSAATRPTASSRPSPRPGASTARTRPSGAGSSSRAQVIDNLLKQTIFKATQRPGPRLARQRLRRQRRASSGSTTSTTSASRSRPTTTPRRSTPTAAPTPGLGGVIRDPLGTGLGAKPICNTDVFCVAPPDLAARRRCRPACSIPGGCSRASSPGVRDYGNRMGIPTVNGALVGRSRATWPTRWSSAARSA